MPTCPLLHMDVKKFGKFTEPGHEVTGDRRRRSRRVGWEYCHSIVDDCSRLAYSELHDDARVGQADPEAHRLGQNIPVGPGEAQVRWLLGHSYAVGAMWDRTLVRARFRRDVTVPTGIPRAAAISAYESSDQL